ncbi:MAG: 2-oxoacid:acceptor oxidoreductase subunit alpha [Chloroflexi bacterium]|nr:2-oxoacid:acceptor oxidoreductase subunit alpha [Chloroflexota bacterium]
MTVDFNFMIGGEAGQGIQSVSFILSKAMMRGGYYVYSDQDFESRIRGGHSFSRVRVRDRKVRAPSEEVSILLALNKDTVDRHLDEMKPEGEALVILDERTVRSGLADKGIMLDVPLEQLAIQSTANRIMSNTVALGAALGAVEYDFDLLAGVLRQEFSRHGEKVAEDNVKAARAGYDYALQHRGKKFGQRLKARRASTKIFLTGHEAVAFGAMVAGCKFVAGYPMTPTTSILEYVAQKGRDFGVKVIQTEDEISAINMVVGAGYAGVRAMTATSGGGFCLMVEGLSLAGMTETPVVVVLGQRPGPAIGLPTRTEQGELWFALHAGHGEFPRAILAPGGIDDAFWLTIKAFNLAEKYQSPVIILTDHDLADSYSTVEPFDLSQVTIDRGELLSEQEVNQLTAYKRHLITDSGVSPRALPLVGKALVATDSDEHNEEGHSIEDAETRRQMVLKRMRKLDGLRSELGKPRVHKKRGAKITLVGWGSTYGAIKEAQELLVAEGLPVNVLHLNEIWPFPADDVALILRGSKKNIFIESNATGQLAQLTRRETGIKADATILKFDGRPFSAQYIVNGVKKEAS